MVKLKKRKSSANKKRGHKPRRSGKVITVILAFLAFLVLAELTSLVLNKAVTSKQIFVKETLEFNGGNQTCGAFKPWDILDFPDGRIVLSDQGNKRLLVFDPQGRFQEEIGQKQAGPTTLSELSCLTAGPSGSFYVMDTWNTLIRGFDSEDKALPQVDLNGKGFYGPRGVAWDGSNFVVADTGSHRLVKVAPSGVVLATWGSHGSGKNEFSSPYEVVAGQGRYYVVDRDNNRIQVLDTDGHFLQDISLGAPPQAEALDAAHQILYVSSLDGKFLRAYSLDGKLLGSLVQGDLQNPQPLSGATALSITPQGDLVAVETDKVSVFHPLPSAPGQQP